MWSGCSPGRKKYLLQHHQCLLLVVLLVPILPVVQSFGSASSSRTPHPAGLRQGQRKKSSDWGQWGTTCSCCCSSRRSTGSPTIARLSIAGGTTAVAAARGVLRSGESSPPPPSPSSGRRHRVNETVRTIMDLLTTKIGSTPPCSPSVSSARSNTYTSDWDKMRRYLYRATSSSSSKAKSRGPLTVAQVRKVLTYLDTELFPNRIDLQRSVLQTSPRILSRNIPTQLRPTVTFLQSLYHGPVFWEAIARNPDLLLTTGTGYKDDYGGLDLVERYLRHDLQVSPAKLAQLQTKAPLLFQTSLTQLLSVVSLFQQVLLVAAAEHNRHDDTESQSASASTLPTIRRLLESHPHLFHLSVKDNLRPRLDYLQQRCHLSDADVAQLLHQKTSSAPAILGLSVRDNLQPTLDLLSQLLHGGSENDDNYDENNRHHSNLRRTILQHPQILGLSLSNLRAKIAYFDSLDEHHHNTENAENHGSTTTRLSSRILIRSPAVYSLSLRDNIMPTVEYLAQIWGTGVTRTTANESHKSTDLATLLLEYPSILTLSLPRNLQPTVAFYQRAGYYVPSSLTAAADKNNDHHQSFDDYDNDHGQQQRTRQVIIRGRYLAASLYHRLLPRWHYYQNQLANNQNSSNDMTAFSTTTATTNNNKRLPLHVLAGASDADFCRLVGVELSHYTQFQTEATPHLKFSSQFDTWVRTGVPMDIG